MQDSGFEDFEVVVSGTLGVVIAGIAAVFHSPWWWALSVAALIVTLSTAARMLREGTLLSGRSSRTVETFLRDAGSGWARFEGEISWMRDLVRAASRGSTDATVHVPGVEHLAVTKPVEIVMNGVLP